MLVSTAELSKYMDISFSARQSDAAGYVLSGLQSELESYLRRPIEVDTFEEAHVLEGTYSNVPPTTMFYDFSADMTGQPTSSVYGQVPLTVYLRNTPVTSVQAVTLYSPTTPSASVGLVENTDYLVRRYGVDIYPARPNDKVVVTYTAGLEGAAIPVLRLMILRAAAREMQNMHDDVVGIKDLETRNVAPLQTGFTAEELKALRRWKRVTVN